jgi:hypothetical protein
MAIVQVLARSPWRVRVVFDAFPVGADEPAIYTLTRADGAGTSINPVRAFIVDTSSAEVSLSEPLLDRVVYRLAADGAGSADLSWQEPLPQVIGADREDDPEAEVFGVDTDWLSPTLTSQGDIPEVRGIACLKQDLLTIAFIEAGELFHRPEAGAGVTRQVNGPTPLSEIAGRVRAEWLKDDRVRKASPRITETSAGEIYIRGDVLTVPLAEPIPIASRG